LYQGVSLYGPYAVPSRPIYLRSNLQRALVYNNRFILQTPENDPLANEVGPLQAFEISNHDTKTIFTPITEVPEVADRIHTFELMQESLIVHYDRYKRLLSEQTVVYARGNPSKSQTPLADR
jgi:hypothetical protein